MKYLSLVVFSLFIAVGCVRQNSRDLFIMIKKDPVILEEKGNDLFQYWELKDNQSLWEFTTGEVPDLISYRDSLEMALGEETFVKIIYLEGSISDSSRTRPSLDSGEILNSKYVHSGNLGKLRRINFLEAQLLNYQMSRYPMFSHPTEFHGFILAQDSSNLIRVYFCASDQPWPPKPDVILKKIKEDLVDGWKLKFHLHNHYEPADNSYVGILAPSMSDAQYYKFLSDEYRLEKALITNGFHTVEISKKEFAQFQSH